MRKVVVVIVNPLKHKTRSDYLMVYKNIADVYLTNDDALLDNCIN